MKTIKFIIAALAATVLSVAASVDADAQAFRDESGKIVRGPYETNKFGDNWFVSGGAGFNWTADGVADNKLAHGFGFDLEVMAGKWFSPTFGARFGWQGLTSRMDLGANKSGEICSRDKYNYDYFHADILWNLWNEIAGYNENAIYNIIPYAHFGVQFAHGRELAAGVGLLNNFRIDNHWIIFADARATINRGEQYITSMHGVAGGCSLSLGVTYNIGKCTWTRATDNGALQDAIAALKKANETLAGDNDALTKKNDDLAKDKDQIEKELNELKSREIQKDTVYVDNTVAPEDKYVFYFDINSTNLTDEQQEKARELAKELGNEKIVVAGYADKSTGTDEINNKISYERALEVAAALIRNGISVQNIRTVQGGSIAGAPELGRSVIIWYDKK